MEFTLRPFHNLPATEALRLKAKCVLSNRLVTLSYVIEGEKDSIQHVIPSSEKARPETLWKHTCFEFFLIIEKEKYLEWNFSLSGLSYCYQFDSYRKPTTHSFPELLQTVSSCTSSVSKTSLSLNAELHLPFPVKSSPKGTLASVLEFSDKSLSYWAVKHSRSKPDFHAVESFVSLNSLPHTTRHLAST